MLFSLVFVTWCYFECDRVVREEIGVEELLYLVSETGNTLIFKAVLVCTVPIPILTACESMGKHSLKWKVKWIKYDTLSILSWRWDLDNHGTTSSNNNNSNSNTNNNNNNNNKKKSNSNSNSNNNNNNKKNNNSNSNSNNNNNKKKKKKKNNKQTTIKQSTKDLPCHCFEALCLVSLFPCLDLLRSMLRPEFLQGRGQ